MNPNYPSYAASIHHDGSRRYVQRPRPHGYEIGDVVTLRLRAAPQAPIERVLVRTAPDGEQQFTGMEREEGQPEKGGCVWWRAALRLDMPYTTYRFLIFTPDGAWWYNAAGLHEHLPTDGADFRLVAGYQGPAWVRSSVFYQIFPDRFADGDPRNNVRDGEYGYGSLAVTRQRRWGEKPAAHGLEAMLEFFGGDLTGVEQRLDYLQELDINAIYLNPIFTAYSNHRYDVIDYENVDPHLGGNEALVSLREEMTRRGMHLILDIVPNHCGVFHPWFQAAAADPNAPTAEFFTFYEHPKEYACWLGVRGLPKFNYNSGALRHAMYQAPDAVFRRWLKPPYSIDGWRVDVANMLARQGEYQLGFEVGAGIRQAVKEENPQAYLLGENFFDASQQLQGDLWDGVMNYSGFAKPLWFWLSRFHVRQHGNPDPITAQQPWPTRALVRSWQEFRAAIPWEIALQQYNLLGSHDTPRILSLVAGDQALNRLAVGLMFTYVGVPSVYYGDETGMGGEADASLVRACMNWNRDEWDQELFQFYRTLIGLRRSSPALIEGGFQALLVEADTLAFLRDTEDEQIIVIGHRGPAARPAEPLYVGHSGLADGTAVQEVFSGRQAVVMDGWLPLAQMAAGIEIWRTQPQKYSYSRIGGRTGMKAGSGS